MVIAESVKRDSKDTSRTDDHYEYIVPAVDRAARILRLLRAKGRGMTIAEVSEATGWHKSSVHKLLVTLSHHGLLERNEVTKQYSLGIALIEYGQFVLKNLDIAQAAKTFLKELAEYSGETANYSIRRGTQMVVVDSVESRINLRVVPPIGTMNTIIAKSSGKAVLAYLPESEVDAIMKSEGLPAFTKHSITDAEAFRRELMVVRKRGYATDFEEFREGINGVSAPVINSTNQVVGTLSLIAPAFRLTKQIAPDYGRKCAEMAVQLSAMIHDSV